VPITSKSYADQRVSNQALEAMMDFDKRLPLLDLSLIPASDTSRLFRDKSCLIMGCGGFGGGDDGNGRDDRPQPKTLTRRNGNTCTQPAVGLGPAGVWVPIRHDAIERRK
jgi:hypothetical protein